MAALPVVGSQDCSPAMAVVSSRSFHFLPVLLFLSLPCVFAQTVPVSDFQAAPESVQKAVSFPLCPVPLSESASPHAVPDESLSEKVQTLLPDS